LILLESAWAIYPVPVRDRIQRIKVVHQMNALALWKRAAEVELIEQLETRSIDKRYRRCERHAQALAAWSGCFPGRCSIQMIGPCENAARGCVQTVDPCDGVLERRVRLVRQCRELIRS